MIRVNLLRDRTAPKRRLLPKMTVSQMGLICGLVFLLATGGMGAWYVRLGRQVNACREKQRVLRAEDARLAGLKKEVARYERMKQLLAGRIDVIEQLKEKQKAPVLLLNHIIQSMPPNGALWLTQLAQKDDRVRIIGYTEHTEVLPDFMSNLASSGIFQTVDLELMETQKDATKFSIVCASPNRETAE
jgi:Tfp pilus assembly protein PilN